jgi:hypothetical protein
MAACDSRTGAAPPDSAQFCGKPRFDRGLSMTMKLGQKITVESLELELSDPTRLELRGTLSTPTAQAEFRKYLQDLHAQIVSARMAEFQVDVRALSFVNSSAIRAFVDWISRAAHAGYKLLFTTSPNVTWHRLSFTVLKSLAPDTVQIVESAPGGSDSGRHAT